MTEAEAQSPAAFAAGPAVPFPFENAAELLEIAEREKVSIADIMMRNECVVRSEQEVRDGLDRIWSAMSACIDRGLRQEGVLPGGLNVKRRAAKLRETLEERERNKTSRPTDRDGLDQRLGAGRQRRERGGRQSRDRADQRSSGRRSRGAALLRSFL